MSDKTKRHPVNHVADVFGVDRMAMTRRLNALNIQYAGGITYRQGFEAWTAKDDRDADRARRQKAEADNAEMGAEEKRGALMLRGNHIRWVKDYGTKVRATIMAASISSAEKKKLCGDLTKIEVE